MHQQFSTVPLQIQHKPYCRLVARSIGASGYNSFCEQAFWSQSKHEHCKIFSLGFFNPLQVRSLWCISCNHFSIVLYSFIWKEGLMDIYFVDFKPMSSCLKQFSRRYIVRFFQYSPPFNGIRFFILIILNIQRITAGLPFSTK